MSPAVLTEDLSKVYIKRRSLREMVIHPFTPAEQVAGLRDVDLSVERGEIFGLLGPNGAGKTTLLKVLACLILPTRGRALVDGATVGSDDLAAKVAIGFVTSDERSFYWRLTGKENLIFFARLYRLSFSEARRRTAELIAAMDLEEVADRQFMTFSSGMKQRLAIARALLHDPPILCLDEPTRSLDPIAAKHLRSFVKEKLNRGQGKTILLATHNLQEAEEMCDRLAILNQGRVLRQGRITEITDGLPGRDQYVLKVTGLEELPAGPSWSAAVDRSDETMRFDVAVDRGGGALSELLRSVLKAGGTIVSCHRKEPSLQEVFDLMEPSGRQGGNA